jgi:hypothetical protein
MIGEDVDHGLRRVHERPELLATGFVRQVLQQRLRPGQQTLARVAEDQRSSSVVCGSTQKTPEVRVAADDSMQHHHVGLGQGSGVCSQVYDSSGHAFGQSDLVQEARGLGIVRVGQLGIGRLRCPPAKQLKVQPPDTATDLQDGGTLQPLAIQEVDHVLCRVIQPRRPQLARSPTRVLRGEDGVVLTGIATRWHRASIPLSKSGSLGIGLVDAERVALGIDVVPLPGHADERHLGQRDLRTGVQDAAFGGVVVVHLYRADEGIAPILPRVT